MCLYWKKVYLCGCCSHLFRDRCPPCLHSSATDRCDRYEQEAEPRKSYFKCYNCLLLEDGQEKKHAMEEALKVELQRKKDAEKARNAQIRREAELRAQKEREEEISRKRELKLEQERMKREGASWVDAGSKRGKGRKGARDNGNGGGSVHASPQSAPPTVTYFPVGPGVFAPLTDAEVKDTNVSVTTPSKSKSTSSNATMSENKASASNTGKNGRVSNSATPKNGTPSNGSTAKGSLPSPTPAAPKDNGVDPGGRAGRWGPKTLPKEILKPERKA